MKKTIKNTLFLLVFMLTPMLWSTRSIAENVSDVVVGTPTGPTSYAPVNLSYNNSCSQTAYTPSSLKALQSGSKIVSLSYFGINETELNNVDFEVYLSNSESSQVSTTQPDYASMTKVFAGKAAVKKSATMDDYSEIITFNLDKEFVYDGTNLIVTIKAYTPTKESVNFAYQSATNSMSYTFYMDEDPVKNLYLGSYRPVIKLGVIETGKKQEVTSVGTLTDTSNYGPLTLTANHSASETIYTKDMMNIPAGKDLQSITYKGWVQSKDNGEPFNIKVWVSNTDETCYTGVTPTDVSTMTNVFDGELTFPQAGSYGQYDNILTIPFKTPFKYEGGNLKVVIQSDNETTKYVYFGYDGSVTNSTIYCSGDDAASSKWYTFSGMPVVDIKYTEGTADPVTGDPDIIITTNKEIGDRILLSVFSTDGIVVDYGKGIVYEYPYSGTIAVDNEVVDSIIKIHRFEGKGKIQTFSANNQKLRNIKFNTNEIMYLELPSNDFTYIDLSGCSKLERLNLRGNKFEEFEINNESLTYLDVSKNNIEFLNIANLVNLEHLDASINMLRSKFWINLPKSPKLKYLNLSYNMIFELYLKDFPNLETLICNNNNIEYLDLSSTPNLKELVTFYNKIVNIDLSPCLELRSLNMLGTQITDIDLSENPYLENLNLSKNNLKDINLENNINLVNLEINNNQLTELNLSANQYLKHLNYAHNNIKEIDLSQNDEINYLDCSENGIAEINTNNLSKVDTLICRYNKLKNVEFYKMEYLSKLDCSSNEFTDIDLNGNIYLTNLNCFDNHLSSLNLTEQSDLISLNINSNNFDKDALETIFIDIPDINGLQILDEEKSWKGVINYDNNPGTKEADTEILSTKGWLFDVAENVIGDASAAIVVSYESLNTHYTISMITSDTEVSVDWGDGNPITYKGEGLDIYTNISGVVLGETIKIYAPSTIELGIARSDIQRLFTDGMPELQRLACSNNNINELNLSNNKNLEDLVCGNNPLASLILPEGSCLKTLNCDKTLLRTIDFKNMPSLTELSLNENRLTKIDLSKCKELKIFSAYKNEIEEINFDGCEKLEEIYISYNKLKNLDVSNNDYLTFLSCTNNELENINVKYLGNLKYLMCSRNKLNKLEINSPLLVELLAGDNPISDIDLSECYNITTLELSDCKLSTLDLTENTNIKQMFVNNNNLSNVKFPAEPLDKLSIVQLSNNKLSSLDINAIKNVKELVLRNNKFEGEMDLTPTTRLDMLIIDNNKVEKLKFPDDCVLTTLYARYNNLRTLNIPGANLFAVDCTKNNLAAVNFSKHTNLYVAFLDFNELKSVNLANNKNLVGLSIRMNQFGVNSLNNIYEQIPDISDKEVNPELVDWMKYLFISGNPGAEESETSIATSKGWMVIYDEELPVMRNLIVNVKDKNGNAIEDVNIAFTADGYVTDIVPSSSVDGSYVYDEIITFKNVSYSIILSKDGYVTKEVNVEGLFDGDIVIDVTLDYEDTSIDELSNGDFRIIGGKNCILISTDKESDVRVYSITGNLVCEKHVYAGNNLINGIARGIYIVNGKKIVVR